MFWKNIRKLNNLIYLFKVSKHIQRKFEIHNKICRLMNYIALLTEKSYASPLDKLRIREDRNKNKLNTNASIVRYDLPR